VDKVITAKFIAIKRALVMIGMKKIRANRDDTF
jgi:hypothetical protein